LSIVSAVVSAHSGRVGVAATPGGGATFRLELPLAAVKIAQETPDADQDVDLSD
jgi:two-component system OmpR family sensor kinase